MCRPSRTPIPTNIPYGLHRHGHRPYIRYARELTNLSVKLRQTDTCWEIIVFAPEFDRVHLNMRIVKYPNNSSKDGISSPCDALLIDGSKLVGINCSDGSILEKVISARSLIPLGADADASSLSITTLEYRTFLFKILKK
jgi:hypothetical protein